jgi:hypothetical protein
VATCSVLQGDHEAFPPLFASCRREVASLALNLEKESVMSWPSFELQPLELLFDDLLRPLGAFEELFCLFDQHFPTNVALAAK